MAQRTASPPPPAAEPAAAAAPPAEEVYIPERPPAPGVPVLSNAAAPAAAPATKSEADKGKKVPVDPKAKPPTAPVVPPLSPRFQQVRDRIDALLRHRNGSPEPIDPRTNPFRPAGAAPVVTAAAIDRGADRLPPAPVVSPSDLTLLQQAAAVLKVAGTIQINGLSHLVINQVPYKEGDVINTRVKGQPVFLRVKNISRYSYTLSLNAAELSIRY